MVEPAAAAWLLQNCTHGAGEKPLEVPMPAHPGRPTARQAAAAGALAGLLASIAQSAIGYVIDRALLPPEHDNNISPRLVDRATNKVGVATHPVVDWTAGVLFHFAYGIGWGVLYGLVQLKLRAPKLLLGSGFGAAIWLAAFSHVGVGTHTQTEQHPDHRPLTKQLDLLAIPFAYALPLALLYEPIERWLTHLRASEAAEAPKAVAQPLAGLGDA